MTEYTQFKYSEGMSAAETKKLVDSKELDLKKRNARIKARALSRIKLYSKRNWFGC